MVILITGASHTGKTFLAQRMLEAYHYPYLSIDHLKMGLIRSGNTNLTTEDDEALVDYLWPIVREIIKTVIENCQNLIVEGCYVPFGWRHDFEEKYLQSIRFICLAMTEQYIESHFDQITGYESVIESRYIDTAQSIEELKRENLRCLNGFRNHGEQVAIIDADFEHTLTGLLDYQKEKYDRK